MVGLMVERYSLPMPEDATPCLNGTLPFIPEPVFQPEVQGPTL
ncbi:hypothetical protein B932_2552 [Gluconobacter oxydans H24]|nr:hypothetical protein B932_2552 [Gluconobacter oxydans H24]